MCNLVLIGRMVSEKMFENNGHIHLFSSYLAPLQGQTRHWCHFFINININALLIWSFAARLHLYPPPLHINAFSSFLYSKDMRPNALS